MMQRLTRLLLVAAGLVLIAPEVAEAQPIKRDHRTQGPPTSAPPAARVEKIGRRKGAVWINGHWDWRGEWVWVPGRFEKSRKGKRWRDRRWEQKGGVWVVVEGDWDNAPDYPTFAPPPPQRQGVVKVVNLRGQLQVSIPGHWEWKDYEWVWVNQRYEPFRPGKRYVPGEWKQQGDRWVWTNESWVDDMPTGAPPPPKVENRPPRAGFVWVAGSYQWQNGQWMWARGRWERERPNQRWRDGRWEQKGNAWIWIDGAWETYAEYPTMAPPEIRTEPVRVRRGFVWVPGHWDWRRGEYVWVAGHFERARRGHRWRGGRWQQRNNRWEWDGGAWEVEATPPPPPGTGNPVPPPTGTITPTPPPPPPRGTSIPAPTGTITPAPPPPPPVTGPTAPPPPPKAESVQPRAGYIWVPGNYQWRNGAYTWINGHWERAKAKMRYIPGQWKLQGNVYVWIEGRWSN
jgi:hypothetical protein